MGRQYRLGRRMSYFTPSSVVGARWQEPPPPAPWVRGASYTSKAQRRQGNARQERQLWKVVIFNAAGFPG